MSAAIRTNTVRIRRHVPFFSTSRDAAKYERLKTGLVLYRLVFGQVDQEDLLESLQQQTEGLDPAAKDAKLRRLPSYMLNLSPIGHDAALRYALAESDSLLVGGSDYADLRQLLMMCKQLLVDRAVELSDVKAEVEKLVCMVERAVESGNTRSGPIRKVVAALAYLRNPYDHIFDLHTEGGFVDDIDEIQKAWSAFSQGEKSRQEIVSVAEHT